MKDAIPLCMLTLMVFAPRPAAATRQPAAEMETREARANAHSLDRLSPRGDPVALTYRYSAPANLEDTRGTVRRHELAGRGAVPLHRSDDDTLAVRAGYRWHHFALDEVAYTDNPIDLHRFQLSMLWRRRFPPRFQLTAVAGVVHASDMRSPEADAWQPSILALGTWQARRNMGLVFGAGLSRQFFELAPFPILGVVLASRSNHVRLEVLLPRRAELAVQALTGRVFARAELEGLTWAVSEGNGIPAHQLQLLEGRVGLGGRWAVGPIWVEPLGGVSAFGRYRFRTAAQPSRITSDTKPAPYAQFSVGIRLP